MKRKLLICCVVALALSLCLAACTKQDDYTDEILEQCLSKLSNLYKDATTENSMNYVVVGETPSYFDDDSKEWTVTVLWEVQGTTEVTIALNDAGNYTVTVPTDVEEDINYTLVGTLVNGDGEAYKDADGNTYSVTLTKKVPAGTGKGTEDSPYSVDGALAKFATLASKSYSDEKVYVKGMVVTAPTENTTYSSYTFYIADTTDGEQMQVYSAVLQSGVSAPSQNDIVTLYGYVEKYNDTLEVTYLKDSDGKYDNAAIIACTKGTSTISAKENANATITLDATSGLNGTTFTFAVAAKNGYELSGVYVNSKAVTAGSDGKYTGTINGDTVVSVALLDPNAQGGTISVDMTKNFETYSAGWGNSYSQYSVSSADLDVTAASITVEMSRASKQTGTITNMPTLAAKKDNASYVTISIATGNITSVTFNLQAWSAAKSFKTLCVEYTTDGTNWKMVSGVGVKDADPEVNIAGDYETLTATIPSGVKSVRLVLETDYEYNNSASNQQVGFKSFEIVVGEEKEPEPLTDAEKVAEEKAALQGETIYADQTIALAANGATYSDVAITWALNDTYTTATLSGNSLAIVCGDAAETVVLTATLTCGETTDTVEVTYTVAAKGTSLYPSGIDMTTVAENTAYRLVIAQKANEKTLYLTNAMSGYYGVTTESVDEADDVYVELVTGGYKLYFKGSDGTKTYISVVVNGTYYNLTLETEGVSTWTWDTDKGAFITTASDGTQVNLGTYNTHNTYGVSKLSYWDDSTSFPAYLVATSSEPAVEKTDAEKIAAEAAKLETISITADGTTTLSASGTTYSDVAITWAFEEGYTHNSATLSGNTLTVTLQDSAESFVLVATLTCGTETDSKQIMVNVSAKSSSTTTTEHAGTAEDPLTVEEAVALAETNGETGTAQAYYVKGIVVSTSSYNSTYASYTFEIADSADGNVLKIYSVSLADGVSGSIYQNDTVVVCGQIFNYNGNTPEIGYSLGSPAITSITVGTSTITFDAASSNNATVTDLSATSGLNGSTFTFKATADNGYTVNSVKVNGTIVTATNDVYTGTVQGTTTIVVETLQDGVSYTTATYDFSGQSYENATEVSTATFDGVTVTFDKGTNSNSPKYYTSGTAVRVYAGGTMTVSVAEGKTICRIVITFGDGDNTNEITVNVGTYSDGNWSGSSNSVTFTVGGTTGHRRVKSIEVIYA